MIMMLKSRCYFGGITVISKSNFRKGEKIYDFYDGISTNFHTLMVDPWIMEKYCKKEKIGAEEYIRCLKDIARRHLKKGMSHIPMEVIDSYVDLLKMGPGHAKICEFSRDCLKGKIFIENNGDVYPCCCLRHKELYLGNILRDPLDKILNCPTLNRLRKRYEFIKKDCKGCVYLDICSGGCMGHSHAEGDILRPSRTWCSINRSMFKYIGQTLKAEGEKLAVRI